MIWPYMDASGFQRAFAAADEDGSGAVEMEEFDEVVKFTVWLNENRHTIQELEDAFGETVGEDEFCFGYKTLFDVHAYGGARAPSFEASACCRQPAERGARVLPRVCLFPETALG